jgi:hypothetical protein
MRVGTLKLAVAAIAACLPVADRVAAQAPEPDPNVPVQQRPQPDYRPLGLRAGAFLLYPALEIAEGYDSNVFADKSNEKDAFLTVVAPGMTAASQWSRHSLRLRARSEHGFYSDYTRNDYNDFDLGADGTLDITHADQANLDLSFSRGHEDRDSPEDQGPNVARSITQYYEFDSLASYRHNFTRFYTAVRAGFQRFDYQDAVGGIDNEDRDRDRYLTGLRIGYNISPRFDVFVDGGYRWVRYDVENSEGRKRNNEGYILRAGTDIDITSILFGELFAGYTSIDYDDKGFNDASSPVGGGRLTWNVTPLTSIILNTTGGIEETTVTQGGDEASGKKHSDVSLSVWHEVLRNLLLNGYGQWVRDDFDGIDRTDNTFRVGGGLRYLVNRNFSLDAVYTYSTRDSDDNDREYDRNQVRLGLTARL